MYIGLHVKYPLFLSQLNETWIFPTDFPKILKTLWKSVQWEPSCSTWTGGRTDKTKLTFAFRNFWNAPKTVDLTRIFAPNTIYSTNNRLMPHTKGLYTRKSTQGILQFPLQHCLKVWISRGFASTTERINLFRSLYLSSQNTSSAWSRLVIHLRYLWVTFQLSSHSK